MKMKAISGLVVAGVILGFVAFLVATQAYGIPTWWLFSSLKPLSSVSPESYFVVTISPPNPSQLNQRETLLALDQTTGAPVPGANVTVYYGSSTVLSTQTNSGGEATLAYAGSPTIVEVGKAGYFSAMAVLPSAPELWVNGTYISAGVGAAFAVLGPLAAVLVQHRMGSPEPRKKRKKRN